MTLVSSETKWTFHEDVITWHTDVLYISSIDEKKAETATEKKFHTSERVSIGKCFELISS